MTLFLYSIDMINKKAVLIKIELLAILEFIKISCYNQYINKLGGVQNGRSSRNNLIDSIDSNFFSKK
ncbi:hypothetical protein [uncultured Ilyobacter sp.]|uniref:hypothetical protein n=1 Tax=uncultured Ilyobacter sp. TaxID=544433 RepID=UPI00374A0627